MRVDFKFWLYVKKANFINRHADWLFQHPAVYKVLKVLKIVG